MRRFSILLICLFSLPVAAEDAAPSVEDRIRIMDTDHDGQVTVTEVRAYLQSQHGKDYKQALLDEMEIKAGLKSCGSPFSKSLY
jgi:Ca2+-binding EF-hand superfamily protein